MNKLFVVAAVLLIGIVVSGADDAGVDMEMPPPEPSHDIPPVPESMKEDLNANHGMVKRQAGCGNRYSNCHCYYFKLKGYCTSAQSRWRNWMVAFCKAACDLCPDSSGVSCANEFTDQVCDSFVENGYQNNPLYQFTVACKCPKACGLCDDQTTQTIDEAMGTTDFQEECLKAHNDLRAQHGAPALSWCQKCVDFAVQKANSLNNANDGNMRHSSRASRYWDRIHHGENLGYLTDATCESVINYWYDEKPNYVHHINNPVGGFYNGDFGHFTQEVWKSTTGVGCAQSGNFVVCIYEPTGNLLSRFQFQRNVQV